LENTLLLIIFRIINKIKFMNEQFLSLYDYLGRAAGPELGWSVAKYAKSVKAETSTRFVENKRYTGEIKLYTRDLIENYFNHPYHADIVAADKEWYNKHNKK